MRAPVALTVQLKIAAIKPVTYPEMQKGGRAKQRRASAQVEHFMSRN
jgi:hypothetical protein